MNMHHPFYSWPEVMSFLEQAHGNLVKAGLVPEEKPPEAARPTTAETAEAETPEPLSKPLRRQLVKNAFKKVYTDDIVGLLVIVYVLVLCKYHILVELFFLVLSHATI